MVLAWIAVALAFAAPLAAGVALEGWFARRRPDSDTHVGLLYVWVPLTLAIAMAVVLRTHL